MGFEEREKGGFGSGVVERDEVEGGERRIGVAMAMVVEEE